MILLKLAWRNIWRNKRRTVITISATTFAVFFAVVMSSIQKGSWDYMMSSVVNAYFGFVQVQPQGYFEEQDINKAFDQEEVQKKLVGIDEVQGVVPRLENFALASFGKYTHVALIIGTAPEKENQMTNLKDKLLEGGAYFEENEKAVMVSEGIAEKMKMSVGDTLILIGQGYHGVNAAGKFLVKGLLEFGSPKLNDRMIYMPLGTATNFYGSEGKITSLALNINDKAEALQAIPILKNKIDLEKYDVKDWMEMLPELQQARELDTAGARIMLLVLYVIITFVILGTIIMLTKERMREFGILTAIGMNRMQLATSVWLEIVVLGLIGSLVGMVLGFPLVYHFHNNPIDLAIMGEEAVQTYENFGIEPIFPMALEGVLFFSQAVLVFFITTILALYPLIKISKLQPITAMRD